MVTIPFNFQPRSYQFPLLQAMDSGTKRAFCLWHRRAGKDKVLWNMLIKKAAQEVGLYYYFFPTYTQAKKVIWDGIDNDGFSFIGHAPKGITKAKNSQELKIELKNGSIVQLIGTDKYDTVRGTNPRGCVFSEYAFHNPLAWEVVRPILAVNGGWAVFNTTPNGKNHAYKMWMMADDDPDWFTQRLTVDDTNIVSREVLNKEIKEMSREMFLQEYHCSFDVGMIGSVYGEQMELMGRTDRLGQFAFLPEVDTHLFMDLGESDKTAITFVQKDGNYLNIPYYYENNRKKPDFYFGVIDDYLDKHFGRLGKIWLPHDSKSKSFGQEKTAFDWFTERYGAHKIGFIPVNKKGKHEGIDMARAVFPKIRIDKVGASQLVECLENYHYKYDEIKKVFSKEPDHDWTSHGADSFRYFAVMAPDIWKDQEEETEFVVENYDSMYNRFTPTL